MRPRPEDLDYRFPFRHAVADRVLRDWVLADAQAARLRLGISAPTTTCEHWCRSGCGSYCKRLPAGRDQRAVVVSGRVLRPAWPTALAGAANVPIIHPWPNDADWGLVLDARRGDGPPAWPPPPASPTSNRSWASGRPGTSCRTSTRWTDALLDDLRARGFEIGVHGYKPRRHAVPEPRHVSSGGVPGINAAPAIARRGGASARRWSTRNLAWLQMLEIEYDASCFRRRSLPGDAGRRGAASGRSWPARLSSCRTRCRKTTRCSSRWGQEDGAIWREKLDFPSQAVRHGPDAHPPPTTSTVAGGLDLYREFSRVRSRPGRLVACPAARGRPPGGASASSRRLKSGRTTPGASSARPPAARRRPRSAPATAVCGSSGWPHTNRHRLRNARAVPPKASSPQPSPKGRGSYCSYAASTFRSRKTRAKQHHDHGPRRLPARTRWWTSPINWLAWPASSLPICFVLSATAGSVCGKTPVWPVRLTGRIARRPWAAWQRPRACP